MNKFIFFSCLIVFLGLISLGEGFAVGGRYARYSSFVWSSKDTHVLLRPNPQHGGAQFSHTYCDDISAELYQVSIARTASLNGAPGVDDARLVLCAPNGDGNAMFPLTFERDDFTFYKLAPTGTLDLFQGGRTTPYEWKWKLFCGDQCNIQGPTNEDQSTGWFSQNVHELCENLAGPEYRAAHVAELPLLFSSSNLGSNYQSLTLERNDNNTATNAVFLNTKVYAQGNVFPTYVGPSGLYMTSGDVEDLEAISVGPFSPVYPTTIYNDLAQNPSGDLACTHRFAPIQIIGQPRGFIDVDGTSNEDYYADAAGTSIDSLPSDLFFGSLDATLIKDEFDVRIDQVLFPDNVTAAEADQHCVDALGQGFRQATLAEFHSHVKSGWDINIGSVRSGGNAFSLCRFNNVLVRDAVHAVLPVSQTTFANNDLTDDIGNGPVSIVNANDAEVECGLHFTPLGGQNPIAVDRDTFGSIACYKADPFVETIP